MAKKEEGPNPIKDFEELYRKKQIMMNETRMKQHHAYMHAYDTLKDEAMKSGKSFSHIDLDDEKTAEKFAGHMADYYDTSIKEQLGIKDLNDDIHTALLSERYHGFTRDTLKKLVVDQGKNYTDEQHERMSSRHLRELDQDLDRIVNSNIKQSDVEDILKRIGAHKHFKDPASVRAAEVASILRSRYDSDLDELPHTAYKDIPGYVAPKKE